MTEVKVLKIDNVEQHPNADKLTINTIGKIDCISNLKEDGTPRYKIGDLVVYIPTKAIVPDWLLKKVGMWNEEKGIGYLGGSKGNRVKPITLRGIKSEGMLYPVIETEDTIIELDEEVEYHTFEGDIVTSIMDITFNKEDPDALEGNTNGVFTAYSSIDHLKGKITKLRRQYGKDLPVVQAVATEKVHGSNAGVGYNKKNGMFVQSRSQILTPKENDNVACALYAFDKEETWTGLIEKIAELNKIDLDKNTIIVYYEWAGLGINKHTCIDGMKEKIAFIFRNCKVVPNDEDADQYWIPTCDLSSVENGIYNITNFKTWEMDLDLSNPTQIREDLSELLSEFEKNSPIGKRFGFDTNILEGFVVEFKMGEDLHKFKFKGDEHVAKKKTVKENPYTDEDMAELFALSHKVTPSWRLEQATTECGNEMKDLGNVIRWVVNDIKKEEMSEIEHLNDVMMKGLWRQVSAVVKGYVDTEL